MKQFFNHLLFFIIVTFSVSSTANCKLGSKAFTESVILTEIAQQLLSSQNHNCTHLAQMGGSRVLWEALLAGEIDAYPEYTGTLAYELLADKANIDTTILTLQEALKPYGIGITQALGFNNTYALGMHRHTAEKLNITQISDLQQHAQLRIHMSHEFIDRSDGWQGLKRRYQLPQTPSGIEHSLAYKSLANQKIDVTDLYSTDAEIAAYDLITLADSQDYFPDYSAVYLYRLDKAEHLQPALIRLEGNITAQTMITLNAKVRIDKQSEQFAATEYLKQHFNIQNQPTVQLRKTLWHYTVEHSLLVSLSLGAAILVAVPLGILCFYSPIWANSLLTITGILQTIPSLALLVFMIPLFGIGFFPALMALFLYSLLPIMRNTYLGLKEIPTATLESARVLALPTLYQLRIIQLPLALPHILTGIKISAVINIGTATLGALIGAGGYGQPIMTGIRLDDTQMILSGAIPAALMAIFTVGIFQGLEYIVSVRKHQHR